MANNGVSQDEIIWQNEVLEMARQAGLEDTDFPFDEWEPVELIAFAKLVAVAAASKERKEFSVHAVDIARRAIKEEREACAGLCDRFANRMMSAEECADAIRTRGEA